MFYHVSKTDLGVIGVFTPKIPESSLVSKEGNIPRVCVAPSVRDCLNSINGGGDLTIKDMFLNLSTDFHPSEPIWKLLNIGPVTVYWTDQEAYLPPDASDFRANQEHWFLKKIAFMRLAYLDLDALMKGEILLTEEPKRLTEVVIDDLPLGVL